MNENQRIIPAICVKYAHNGRSATADALSRRPMVIFGDTSAGRHSMVVYE